MKKTKLYGKKQRFGTFFLKVFVPFILVTSIMGVIVTYMLVAQYNNGIEEFTQSAYHIGSEIVTEAEEEYRDALAGAQVNGVNYDFETAECRLSGALEYACGAVSMPVSGIDGMTDCAARLYRLEADGTLTLAAGGDSRMFIRVRNENDVSCRLSCTYQDYLKMLETAPRQDGFPTLSGVEEIYVKGNNFWISRYRYYDYDGATDGGSNQNDCSGYAEKSVTVTDIPDGYVKLDTDKGYELTSVVMGSGEVSQDMDYSETPEEIINEFDRDAMEAGSSDWMRSACDRGHHNTDVIMLGDEYYLVLDFHTNFPKSMIGRVVIATWIGIVLISTLLSLAIAYVMYKSYRMAYDREQYRRTTSNAMAHDLKSPLAVISLYAENLKSGNNPEKNGYYMDGILDEVRKMNEQVASILDMAKAEDVDAKLDRTDVDVADIVHTVAKLYAEKTSAKGVRTDISGECTVSADAALMYQAVVNIMDNAVKYVTDGGHITVRLSDSEISFVNSCEPLGKETLANVWKPFVKGDSSRHGHNGTGLGLSIVKTIMDRHEFDCQMNNVSDGVEVKLIFGK